MPTPIKEQIAAAILTRCAAISTGTGYYTNVVSAVRDLVPITQVDRLSLPMVTVLTDDESAESEYLGSGCIRTQCVWQVLGYVESSAIDTAMNQLESDIKRAVLTSQTLGLADVEVTILSAARDVYRDGELWRGIVSVAFTAGVLWFTTSP